MASVPPGFPKDPKLWPSRQACQEHSDCDALTAEPNTMSLGPRHPRIMTGPSFASAAVAHSTIDRASFPSNSFACAVAPRECAAVSRS